MAHHRTDANLVSRERPHQDGAVSDGNGPVHDLLGSASVFASVVTTIVDDVLARVSGENALSLGQLRFLELVAHEDEATVTDLACRVGISSAAVSRNLDKLVDGGLATRRAGSEDRRTVRLGLTRDGQAVLAEYRAGIETALIQHLKAESTEAVAAIANALDHLTLVLLEARSAAPPPCRGCIACNLFRRAECPLGAGRPLAACHSDPSGSSQTARL